MVETGTTEFEPPRVRDVTYRVLLGYLSKQEVGARLLPIKELAKELNVGQSNLHAAMRELGRRGVLVSRQRLGTFLARRVTEGALSEVVRAGAEPAPGAEQVGSFSWLIGRVVELVSRSDADPLIHRMVQAAKEVLSARGVVLEQRVHTEERSGGAGPDVSIYFNPVQTAEFLANPKGERRVVLSTSWTGDGAEGGGYDLVGVDQVLAARLAGEFLRGRGFRDACFAGVRRHGLEFDATSQVRLRGFEAGFGAAVAQENGLDAHGYSLLGGGKAFRRYRERSGRPTAIFAASDDIAIGFLVASAADGLEPGKDYHLIGFDGLRLGRYMQDAALTTVEVPSEAMGRAGAQAALERMMSPDAPVRVTRFECRLFEGATVGACG